MELRYWGLLPRIVIEGFLLADFLYLLTFVPFIAASGKWNIWSLVCSAGFPVAWAPIRAYWLWFAPKSMQPRY